MTDFALMQRLLPCLLDRLTDDDPQSQVESRDRRVISLSRYRSSVLRDLAWLLNTRAPDTGGQDADFAEVARSVLGFGIRDVCGLTVSSINVEQMEMEVRRAIADFEPRITSSSLVVQIAVNPKEMGSNAITFQIKGELWAQPVPEAFDVKTEVDLETGRWDVREGC